MIQFKRRGSPLSNSWWSSPSSESWWPCCCRLSRRREAARRTQCVNNLKQLGVALHNYHDTYQTFPSITGTITQYNNKGTGKSWLIGILPFVEQQQLYTQIDFPVAVGDNTAATSPPHGEHDCRRAGSSAILCPSDGDSARGVLGGLRQRRRHLGSEQL